MEVHQLRYFCAVAETGSFTRAAAREQVAQPSLSQQIMKLEDELGVRLFDRLGRSVRLTEPGKTFLPRARSVLHELEAARGDPYGCALLSAARAHRVLAQSSRRAAQRGGRDHT